MKMLSTTILIATLAASFAAAQRNDVVWFEAVDVFVDSGDEALGAYQFELSDEDDRVKIVGVEGGEVEAYEEPPHYDPKALSTGRIVIAAYSTAEDLPTGRTRVATVHLQVSGDVDPEYTVKLIVAGNDAGLEISAEADVEIVK